jgi:hypothetical protein
MSTYRRVHIFYFYIMYYPFYILVLQGFGLVNEIIFYAWGLEQSGRTRRSSIGWSHHLAVGLHHRPAGQSVRLMDFIANQLDVRFGAHFYSTFTLPPTSWLDCSVLASSPTSWLDCSSLGLHRQLRGAR